MTLKILAGKFKGKKLFTSKNIRPATAKVKEAIFNICQFHIENASFLDIFAGSGALGIEALSRGAIFAAFIDKAHSSAHIIHKNIKNLNLEECTRVIQKDAIKAINLLKGTFDIITIDPPFIMFKDKPKYINELLSLLQTKNLINENTSIFLEEPTYSKRDDKIENLTLKEKRKYGSCNLVEYTMKY
ncbi:MAG: Ribosomal RNA small subunit methyltransferase D [Candidatus Anoxychlamydiales bacterium]|nr:Ribosomal RNA small subunit methyltransferase D [Candidatus Anoxychlamydiales bacterium]